MGAESVYKAKSSIFTRLIGVFVLTALVLFGITYIYFKNTVSVAQTQLQKQNEILVQAVATSIGTLEELSSTPKESQYEKLFEPLSINKRIVSYALIKRDGTIMYAKNPAQINTVVNSRQLLSRSQQHNLTSIQAVDKESGKPVIDIVTPVFQHSTADQSLQIVFSTQELNDLQRKDYQVFAGIALLVALMATLSLFYLARLIRQPLKQVMRGVAAVGSNDFAYRIPVRRDDEIGHLAAAFNNMSASLQESRRHLSQERALLEEAKAQLMAAVRSLPFGFALISSKLDILYSNDELATIIGRPVPKTMQESQQLVKDLDMEYHKSFKLVETIQNVFAKAQPAEYSLPLGTQFLRIFLAPVLVDTRVIGTILIIEDITEAKVLERSRDEFFSIASHELRTPLTTIRGNTNLILDFYNEQLKDPSLHEMMGDIHDSSVRLIAIVNDFLDVSRLEQGRMVFKNEPIDITPLVQDSVNQYKATDLLHGLTLKFDVTEPCWVNADGDRVRQIVNNLVSNALKYTDKGTVTVSITTTDRRARVLVTDSGKGIPEESQPLLFRKFQQASNNILTRDNSQSTGLGLYISLLLSRGMNGTVGLLSSALGKGSTFYLELPRTTPPAGPAPKKSKK